MNQPGASDCSDGMCVVVKRDGPSWRVSDSKDPDGPVLIYTTDAWRFIIAAATTRRPDCIARVDRDTYAWVGRTADGTLTALAFTPGEVAAWLAGARGGQFRPAYSYAAQGGC